MNAIPDGALALTIVREAVEVDTRIPSHLVDEGIQEHEVFAAAAVPATD